MSDQITGVRLQNIHSEFGALWKGIDKTVFPDPGNLPQLAHYTSVATLATILEKREIWFTSPLYMNDTQELAFAITQGSNALMRDPELAEACGTPEAFGALLKAYNEQYSAFNSSGAGDVFIFCMCQHSSDDGLLSMWRGYGNNGNGVALVFDPTKLRGANTTGVAVGRVDYRNNSAQLEELASFVSGFKDVLKKLALHEQEMTLAAHYFFERVKLFALFTKHAGFDEEREWRAWHQPQPGDWIMTQRRDFYFSRGGMPEPNLRMRLTNSDSDALSTVIDKVVAGPAFSDERSFHALQRMIEIRAPDLVDRLVKTQTPYRPRS